MEEIKKHIKLKMKEARKNYGLSVREIASELGVSPQYIYMIEAENNRRNPPYEIFCYYMHKFDLHLHITNI